MSKEKNIWIVGIIGIICTLILASIILFLISTESIVKNEKYYVSLFAEYIEDCEIEYRLKDNTRVDILTQHYAIEVDFEKKWYEAIGQALHYELLTNLIPGIVLIIDDNNSRNLERLLRVAEKYNIMVWSIDRETEIIIWRN